MSEDQLTGSLMNMMNVADKLQNGQHIETNEATSQYLDSVGLSNPGAPGSQEAAQRHAIAAVGAVVPIPTLPPERIVITATADVATLL